MTLNDSHLFAYLFNSGYFYLQILNEFIFIPNYKRFYVDCRLINKDKL
jgi:hypothetical protein